ncbi:MAG: hypothetical protein ACREBG_29170 [Pyrinomonadaceae bacterium]
MNKFQKSTKVVLLTVVLSIISAALIWTWIASPARAQSKSQESQAGVTSIDRALPGIASINLAFRAVKESSAGRSPTTTNDAVRTLAATVLQDFGLDDLPAEITEDARERLVTAEINYRQGQGGAIAETNVVRLIDEFATTWNLPAYARTDVLELRRFRVSLVPLMPDLATRDSSQSLISSNMSPLEATYITLLLIEQKTINPEYQQTPQERAARKKPEKGSSSKPESFFRVQGERENEMAQLMSDIEKQVEGLKPSNTVAIISRALDALGVAKTKEAK